VARGNDRVRDRAKRTISNTRPTARSSGCSFCKEGAKWVDHRDTDVLRRFLSDRGKIRSRRATGNCAQHQRDVAVAIKTARELALMPYAQRTLSERGPGRASRSGASREHDNPGASVATDGRAEFHNVDDIHELEEVGA
jgi:small subunit ribosomal protein S18